MATYSDNHDIVVIFFGSVFPFWVLCSGRIFSPKTVYSLEEISNMLNVVAALFLSGNQCGAY